MLIFGEARSVSLADDLSLTEAAKHWRRPSASMTAKGEANCWKPSCKMRSPHAGT